MIRKYVAPPTIARFMLSNAKTRFLMGPYGSGKSVGCAVELMRRAYAHPPNSMGVRTSQFLIVRNTYRMLKDTTLKTWLQWFPDGEPGRLLKSDMVYEVKHPLEDGTSIEAFFLFRPFDSPDDQKNALSLELTGAWVNEFREIQLAHVVNITGRCGRYANSRSPDAWTGLVADSNHPNVGSDYYRMFEENELPPDLANDVTGRPIMEVFRQPGGLSPHAENIENLPAGYYMDMVRLAALEGKDDQWVNVHVHSMYGRINDGQPVYRGFWNERIHVSQTPLQPDPRRVIGVGYDPGIGHAAAVIGQMDKDTRWRIFGEVVLKNSLPVDMVREVMRLIREDFGIERPQMMWFCDPYAGHRGTATKDTPLAVLRSKGIRAVLSVKDIEPRIRAVRSALSGLRNGEPRLLLDPRCRLLIEGMNGGYRFRKMQTREEKYTPEPDKDSVYSHPHDALQYLLAPFELAHERDGRRRWPEYADQPDWVDMVAGDRRKGPADFNPHTIFRR